MHPSKKASNNRANREYLGLHATFECTPQEDGGEAGQSLWRGNTRFEIQWHTEATITTKEEQCHLIYEKFRVDLDTGHKAQYWEEMVSLWSVIKMPVGADKIGKAVQAKFDGLTAGEEEEQGETPFSPPTPPRHASSTDVRDAKGAEQRANSRRVLLENAQITAACEGFHRAARQAEPVLFSLLSFICTAAGAEAAAPGAARGSARLHGERNHSVATAMTLRRQVVAALLTGARGSSHVNIFQEDERIEKELQAAQRDMLQFTLVFSEDPPAPAHDDEEEHEQEEGYYCRAVRHTLGWLVRSGCEIDRLDNHWACGIGDSGSSAAELQPPQWNALHAAVWVPPSLGFGPQGEAVWMRLHFHTPSSIAVQEGWLREVRSLMGMVISTSTFDDHAALAEKARLLRRNEAGASGPLDQLVSESSAEEPPPAGSLALGIGAHEEPRPPRAVVERRLANAIETGDNDPIGRLINKHAALRTATCSAVGVYAPAALELEPEPEPEPGHGQEIEVVLERAGQAPMVLAGAKVKRQADGSLLVEAQPKPEPEPEPGPGPGGDTDSLPTDGLPTPERAFLDGIQ